jgi:hypothetical protein
MYGHTNMKRAITLTKINHPWILYNMRMLRSWPNMNKIQQKTNYKIRTQMVDFCESYSPFHVCMTIHPSAHLVYASSHLSFVTFYSYLVSWLAMILHHFSSFQTFTSQLSWEGRLFSGLVWHIKWNCTRCHAVIPPLALHKLMCSKVLDYSGT